MFKKLRNRSDSDKKKIVTFLSFIVTVVVIIVYILLRLNISANEDVSQVQNVDEQTSNFFDSINTIVEQGKQGIITVQEETQNQNYVIPDAPQSASGQFESN